jgi:hypothetical protein
VSRSDDKETAEGTAMAVTQEKPELLVNTDMKGRNAMGNAVAVEMQLQ